jgi:hypothetical protein
MCEVLNISLFFLSFSLYERKICRKCNFLRIISSCDSIKCAIIFLKIPCDINHRIEVDSFHLFSYLESHEIPIWYFNNVAARCDAVNEKRRVKAVRYKALWLQANCTREIKGRTAQRWVIGETSQQETYPCRSCAPAFLKIQFHTMNIRQPC